MKYIRTNDGKIHLVLEETEKGFIIKYDYPFDLAVKKEAVIKQADTIEELCNEFVLIYYGFAKPNLLGTTRFHDAIYLIKNGREYAKAYTVYGAIWTDKGLIYVAKVNEKGELELL